MRPRVFAKDLSAGAPESEPLGTEKMKAKLAYIVSIPKLLNLIKELNSFTLLQLFPLVAKSRKSVD